MTRFVPGDLRDKRRGAVHFRDDRRIVLQQVRNNGVVIEVQGVGLRAMPFPKVGVPAVIAPPEPVDEPGVDVVFDAPDASSGRPTIRGT